METAESLLLTSRLMHDLRTIQTAESPLKAADYLCGQWYARADLASILSRRSIHDACYRAVDLINAAAAYRRGSVWSAAA